jgi:putative tryptophan/tyrosine transport system substrate-binding protein
LVTHFADLKEERLASLAQEFVHRRVDIIVAKGTPPTDAARRATTSIPIVMSGASDPIAVGLRETLRDRMAMSRGHLWS